MLSSYQLTTLEVGCTDEEQRLIDDIREYRRVMEEVAELLLKQRERALLSAIEKLHLTLAKGM